MQDGSGLRVYGVLDFGLRISGWAFVVMGFTGCDFCVVVSLRL